MGMCAGKQQNKHESIRRECRDGFLSRRREERTHKSRFDGSGAAARRLPRNAAVARRFRPTPPVHLFASACPINIVCSDRELLIDGRSPRGAVCFCCAAAAPLSFRLQKKEAAGSSGRIAGQLNAGKLKRDESMRPGMRARKRPECEGQTRRPCINVQI